MKLSVDGCIRRSVYAAFAAGVASVATPSFAQETAAPAAAPADAAAPAADAKEGAVSLKSVVVTGTRIRSQTMTASSPVTEISGEEFKVVGATLVEDLVNQYPQLEPVFDNSQNNPSLGYATVDLRGLGPERTLALLNGRRIPKGFGEYSDISIIPAGLIKKVDVLTGGASAVYGSDAVAGVVNFILDDEFDGIRLDGGWSAFQHNNDNKYMQGLLDQRGYPYPTGDSGFEGTALNLDFAIGGSFGETGHATAWATYRRSNPLFQASRDYSSCALNAAGTRCGGSATADPANFYIVDASAGFYGYVLPSSSGTWAEPSGPNLYNFAPINYYQRPDTRVTAGSSVQFEINEHAKPYLEFLTVNRRSSQQLAPSGAFFTDLQNVDCGFSQIGSLCSDLGLDGDGIIDTVYVAKRNVEGGPRIYDAESNILSVTTGIGGKLVADWSYDVAFTYNRASTANTGFNDFLTSRIQEGLLCDPATGCLPYDVWHDAVTPEQAQALQGISQQVNTTSLQGVNAYVTGDLGFALPTAGGRSISLVAGVEGRKETYSYTADSNLESGNFAGSGSESPPIDESIGVREFYTESNIPLMADAGPLNQFDVQLGYRLSNYDLFGSANSYKIGFGANFFDSKYRVRGGYNRAIRAPGLNDLYLPQAIGLWSGQDPCAGVIDTNPNTVSPEYTVDQCALTGLDPAQYGSVAANPASQYNQISGGNPDLEPETADTWTIGLTATPIKRLDIAIDYFDIEISDALGGVGARNLIDICALTGNADACGRINRGANGDLFRGSDPATAGHVVNPVENLGGIKLRGIDTSASYSKRVGPGKLAASTSFTYVLEKTISPLQTDTAVAYDCAGNISPQCQTAALRGVTSLRYSVGRYMGGMRWRYMGALDYVDPRGFKEGTPLTTDKIVQADGGVDSYSWFDLHGSVDVGPALVSFGVNNVLDEEPPLVGSTLTLNGNSIGGYDQTGRYFFTSVSVRF